LQLARRERVSFITYDYLAVGSELGALRASGLRDVAYPGEPGACLDLKARDFAAYVQGLGHDHRQDIRRNMRRAEEAGVRVEITTDVRVEQIRVCELVRNVYRRHDERTMPAPEAFITSAATHVAGDAILLLAYLGEHLAGCGFILQDRGEMALRVLGLDYARDREGHVYRSILLSAIRYAIESGARRVDGGSTAYTFKDRLGFELESTSVAFTSPNPLLGCLGNLAARLAQ
jgi:predicted N-acyltransferase